jgi:hypothetical protein
LARAPATWILSRHRTGAAQPSDYYVVTLIATAEIDGNLIGEFEVFLFCRAGKRRP